MSIYDWSTTAANNDVADAPAIGWAEGMAAAGVNNSARGMMAQIAKFVKDTGGAITSGGSSNAYTLTTNSVLTAHTVPVMLAFEANHTSSGAATIAIDGLSSKSLKRANGTAIQSGDITSGSIYLIAYESGADVYLVLNAPGNYDPSAVAITGGTITGITDLAVADGGTGSSTAAGAATNLGLGTGSSPQFTAVNIGHATDTTLARVSAGVLSVEGVTLLTTATGQGLDATLTALAALNSTGGLVVQTGADTFTKRTLTAGTGISVANGDGVSGVPTVSVSGLSISDDWSVFIAAPSDKTYKIVVNSSFAATINEVTTISASGTCTVTVKINTTALGGTANSASSSETTQTHSSANSVSAGDDIQITVSSNSSCLDLSIKIKYTRTVP